MDNRVIEPRAIVGFEIEDAGLAMPEMIKPQPNTNPAKPLANAKPILLFFTMFAPQTACMITEATTKPVTMKTPVAANDLNDSLERPQTPCPLVQPEPSLVP